jgi:hypothetical protein
MDLYTAFLKRDEEWWGDGVEELAGAQCRSRLRKLTASLSAIWPRHSNSHLNEPPAAAANLL